MGPGQEKVMSGGQTTIWESLVLLLLCALIAVGSLGVIAWVLAAGTLFSLDGLLLTATCLVLALAFGGNVVWSWRSGEAQSILKSLSKRFGSHSK